MGLFSLYGQLCSLTLEAIQSFGLASSGKHSGKHNSPGGEGLEGYRHGRRVARHSGGDKAIRVSWGHMEPHFGGR